MKKLFFSALLLFIACCQAGRAQNGLGVDPSSSVPSPAYYKNYYTYKAVIRNHNSLAYTGPVKVFFTIDTIGNNTLAI
ncbi:MAG TPA: hypothetical protein VNY73_03915, partial [Bacteroidia bacterium]|nr:hypothetical protein [Bacteroidia bacterium]